MLTAIWVALCLAHKAISAPVNVSSEQPLDDALATNFSSGANSAISFESDGYSFQGTRDDGTDLPRPKPPYTSQYAHLLGKGRGLLGQHDSASQVQPGKYIVYYSLIKTAIQFSRRAPTWTYGQARIGIATLLGSLANQNCGNPVNVHIILDRRLLTFTTSTIFREPITLTLPPSLGVNFEAMAGFTYPTETLDQANFRSAVASAYDAVASRGEDLVPNHEFEHFIAGKVVCRYHVSPPVGFPMTYSDLKTAFARVLADVPAVVFTTLLVKGGNPQIPRSWTPVASIRCLQTFAGVVNAQQGGGSDNGQDDVEDDTEADWSELLSEMAASTNSTLNLSENNAQNGTIGIQIFST